MNRRIPILFLALAVFAPGLHAQQDSSARKLPSGDESDVFASALHAIASMHMDAPTDSSLLAGALQGMIQSLYDPYAAVYTVKQGKNFDQETTGSYSGIGLTIQLLNKRVTVTAVFRKTPAANAGIQLGDQIIGVNHHDATSWSTEMASDSIKGPVGTSVTLKIARPGYAQPFTFELQRDSVHVPAVSYGVLDGDIGYIVLDRVARNAAREMDGALRHLSNTHGLIIDLRGNPGGFLDESLWLADLFLPEGDTLASTRQRIPGEPKSDVDTEAYEARMPPRVPHLPIVMLVDGYTASGAEIFAGALQDHDRALILGQRSFGKGVMQSVIPLPHGQRMKFTTGTWLTPLGRSLHRPRAMDGQPLPEDTDTLPVVTTADGRKLRAGGGIFPDLPIKPDTLTLNERALLRAAGKAQFPLAQKISEFALRTSKDLLADSTKASLNPDSLHVWMDSLVAGGLPDSTVYAPGVRSYLSWEIRMRVAQQMDEVGREARFRMERDPVLTEAVHLLSSANSQKALFAEADKARAEQDARRADKEKVGANH